MTKDEARADDILARMEACRKAYVKKATECREKGFPEPSSSSYGMGYGDGWEARDAVTCVWTWSQPLMEFETACGNTRSGDIGIRPDFCEYCGGKAEVKQ